METNIISQNPVRNFSIVISGTPAGYGQANITNTAVNLPSIPSAVDRAIVQIETGDNIRWRDDKIDPTASVGSLLYAANIIELNNGASIKDFRCIGVAGTGVTLNVAYYSK